VDTREGGICRDARSESGGDKSSDDGRGRGDASSNFALLAHLIKSEKN
jgi:hypothetical protein